MIVKSIRIHNFRTFDDGEITLCPYSSLVGANNSGKTNIIDALRVFYEKDLKYQESRDFPKFEVAGREVWVEIEYLPSTEEFQSLKDEYKLANSTFRVRKYFQSSEKDAEGKLKSGIYAYTGGSLSDSRFYGAKNVQQGKLGDIIYIPAVSKLDETTKLTGPSPLRDLLNSVVKRVMENSASYASLKESFEAFEKGIKNESTSDGQSLARLEKDITKEISDWGTRFELTIGAVSPDDLVKGLVDHRIFDSDLGVCQESKCYGQGFQRHLIFTLIRLAAKYTSEKPTPSRKEFSPEMSVILFEEPEAFLHPAQIAVLDQSIRTLTKSPGTQVLISTHNPLFVSRSIQDLPSLTRLHRDGAKARPYRVSEEQLANIIFLNQDALKAWVASGILLSEDDLTTEMETLKYSLWLDSRRCAGFFANRILLVEGQTEVALFDYLINSGQIKVPREGVFIFDSLGKFNIHRFMNLFASLGIPHSVLYDDDNGKNAIVSSTIQNAKNGLTIGIDSFPKDIEDFLGIPPADKPHKKPQHVMYQVAQGKVSADRMDELCTKVAKVLSLDNG